MTNLSGAVCVMALLSLAASELTTEMCPSATRRPTTCILQSGTKIELSWSALEYITLECLGNGTFTCAELPKVNIPSPMRVMIVNCVLPANESLSCTFQALGAPGATLLTIRGAHSFLKPKHVQNLHLSTLNLKGSTLDDPYTPLIELPTAALAALPLLKNLVVTESRLNLSSDSLAGVSQLKYLELSASDIKGLNESVFRGLKSLLTLSLWGNDLRELQNGTLDGLHSLQSLELSDPLRSLGEGVLATAKTLRVLKLTNIELGELSQSALRDLNELEELIIWNGRTPLKVGSRALSLPKLRVVRIEHCSLETLSGDALAGAQALQTLFLSHNALETLPSELLSDLTDLRALNLSYNALRSLEPALFQSLVHLEELKLDHNHLEVFSGALFQPLTALRVLSARNNHLSALWSTEFQGLGELQELDLAHNQLTLSGTPGVSISPFHAMKKLRLLDLGYNNITQVFYDWRNSLLQLQLLDLRYNWIEFLEDTDTNFLSNVTVDFRYNQISLIKIEEENQYARVDPEDTRKGTLLLDENPFHCDCSMYRLLRLMDSSSYAYIHPAMKLDAAVCATPPALADTKLRAAPLDKLTCELPTSKCPINCNCTSRPARNTVELECIEPPDTAPAPEPAKDFNHIALRLRRAPLTLDLSVVVHELQLAGLGLTKLPSGSTPIQLELLDLTDNLLSEVPLASGGYKLRLAGNPLACDCAHYDAVNVLLLSTNRIQDWNNVTCAGGRFLKHIKDADALCAEVRAAWAASIGGALALLGLVAIVVTILWLRHQNEIKVYLFAHGWCGCLTRSGKEAPAKYDVFLSFSHEDEEVVVQKLVPELEQRGYRLCVHYRDWAPGEAIAEHLSRSVREARRTLVVVSPGFLRSEWARAEFREAHARALREGRSSVIVVLLGELPAPEPGQDDDLRAYLRTNTYVAWGDAWFWPKLQYALPHHPLGLQEDIPLVPLSSRLSADKLRL
ncbi:protein toll-like [Cydia pomonella]|uniref:protein toll-like n=1 Tax=Cydia pomonella TaxID=82600 RepID=UPI002ADDA30F|nr:protein toll-like [Cydia pomonella]XP_061708091.1 protein toll-like [Cydia pomonella]